MGNSMQSLLIHSGSIYEEEQEQVKNDNSSGSTASGSTASGSTASGSTNNFEENVINDKNQMDRWLEYVNAW